MPLRRSLVAGFLVAAVAGACSGSDAPDKETVDARSRIPQGAHFTPPPIEVVTEPPAGWLESACGLPLELLERMRRGYYPDRSPEILIVPREPNFFGGFRSTSHSGPWDYLQRVPLVFYGPGFIRPTGEISLNREVTVADIAPTIAELLDFPFGDGRAGRPLSRILVSEEKQPGRPAVVMVVALDGGGWNVLDVWPEAWPNLARLMSEGASLDDAIVGSSPSITPSIHTNIGTGAFPNQHGITAIDEQIDGEIVGSYPNKSPKHLRISTLADEFDLATGNVAEIGLLAYRPWHLGMIGHGAMTPGGDEDVGVIVNLQERLTANNDFYSVPAYLHDTPGLGAALREIDLLDGRRDDTWMGHAILDNPQERRDTPAWVVYQTKLITTILRKEGYGQDGVPDLFFTNYKQIDEIGHAWNMLSHEMEEVIRYSDAALKDLEGWLNRNVGRRRWVMVVTADHGQGPDPIAARAWPIRMSALESDLSDHFGLEQNELIKSGSIVGFWFHHDVMEAHGISEGELADFFVNYRLEENNPAGEEFPPEYETRRRELLFEAAFPAKHMRRVLRCASEGAGA